MTESSGRVGVSIPTAHTGAFVAEVFEDAERSTSWDDVVSALVAPDARDAWDALSPTEQVVEVLAAADRYDEMAVAALREVEEDGDVTVRSRYDEAIRCRRNADTFRDGIAAAYGDGTVSGEELVDAVEAFGFETDRIARREALVERVAKTYEFEFRPYGGTLMDPPDEGKSTDAACDWSV